MPDTVLSNFIAGRWQAGSGAELITIDPATGRETWRTRAAAPEDVAAACSAARAAFEPWAERPLVVRIAFVTRFSDLLKENN
jgi:succinylglutamic semialdehyde dehydrogenase